MEGLTDREIEAFLAAMEGAIDKLNHYPDDYSEDEADAIYSLYSRARVLAGLKA